MEFKDTKAIYLQIADYVCEHILLKKWDKEEKIPSVREMAVELEVNPNTVMRTYELLQNREIIFNKRGVGFYLTEFSVKNIMEFKKTQFINEELPSLFRNIYLLNIDFDELRNQYAAFIKENFNA